MATCPNCKGEMGSMAPICLHCGYDFPLQQPDKHVRRPIAYAADFAIGLLVAVFGLFIYFHVKHSWLGGWMGRFGDPPVSNPSYRFLSPYFFAAPYVVSGIVVGLLAGCGQLRFYSLLIRFLVGPVALGVLLIVTSDNMGGTVFLPSAIKFFCISVGVSAFYNFINARNQYSKVQSLQIQ